LAPYRARIELGAGGAEVRLSIEVPALDWPLASGSSIDVGIALGLPVTPESRPVSDRPNGDEETLRVVPPSACRGLVAWLRRRGVQDRSGFSWQDGVLRISIVDAERSFGFGRCATVEAALAPDDVESRRHPIRAPVIAIADIPRAFAGAPGIPFDP